MNSYLQFVSDHPMYGVVNGFFFLVGVAVYVWIRYDRMKENRQLSKNRRLPNMEAVRLSRRNSYRVPRE